MPPISRTVRIGSSHGLHARPAKLFAQAAKEAGIPITIAKDSGSPVNAASILGVIALGLEQEAVAYAVAKGALVVAAVGNGDQAPGTPWRFASYPAALPHVLGVSALGVEQGDYVTLTAAGEGADATLDNLAELLTTDHDAA